MPEPRAAPWSRRLFLRIYLAVLGIVAALVVIFALGWHVHSDPRELERTLQALAPALERALPRDAPPAGQRAALEDWHARTGMDIALYAPDGVRLAGAGRDRWGPRVSVHRLHHLRLAPPNYAIALDGDRVLLLHGPGAARMRPWGIAVAFGLVALLVGLGCYPIVRRLTGRLERLQRDVEAWDGNGPLQRIRVDGHDEIAALATSFNAAADRIGALLRAQKSLLANASHELRSPLTRLRMAVELLPQDSAPALRDELVRSIGELDTLVGEVLLASRLDAQGPALTTRGPVDLRALVAEECHAADVGCTLIDACVAGDERLLRRLVRNLLDNARRHGRGAPVHVALHELGTAWRLEVRDAGPGIPASERERVFEPFHRLPGASEDDGGVGLGLALVRQIARLHGGDVGCAEAEGGGTVFEVTLPRV